MLEIFSLSLSRQNVSVMATPDSAYNCHFFPENSTALLTRTPRTTTTRVQSHPITDRTHPDPITFTVYKDVQFKSVRSGSLVLSVYTKPSFRCLFL